MLLERWWYAWRVRLQRLLYRGQTEHELTEELRSHVAQDTAARRAEGLSPIEARRQALAALGGMERTKESVRAIRPGARLEQLVQDVRYGVRMLRRNPGFALASILTLTLGIGATTTIFSVVDAVLLEPPPFPDPSRLVTLWQTDPHNENRPTDVSPGNFLDWRAHARSFEHVASIEPYSFDLTGRDEPQVLLTGLVTDGFFEALDIDAAHGRTFRPEEYRAGGPPVVVLTDGAWKRRFGADPTIVGQPVTLDDQPHTVVGVLPQGFELGLRDREREVFAPKIVAEYETQIRGSGWWHVVARLRSDRSLADAQAEMTTIAGRLSADYPRANAGIGARVIPLHTQQVGTVRSGLILVSGAVAFLLLIACVNVANLMLTRCIRRRQEFAIRMALGGGPGRLLRQLLTESLVVATLGGLGGVALAFYSFEFVVALGPANVPRLDLLTIDGRVLGFATMLVVLTAIGFGVAPALFAMRANASRSLTPGARGGIPPRQRRLRSGLVAAEVALALVLLVGAGLLVQSFNRLVRVDLGFSPEDTVALQVFAWDRHDDGAARTQFFRQTLDEIEALPGISQAAAASAVPLAPANFEVERPFTILARAEPPPGEEPTAAVVIATPQYFDTMGIPLIHGRGLDVRDDADRPGVAVVNEVLARRYWPTADPIGERIAIRTLDGQDADVEIVGVVGAIRPLGFESLPRPDIFLAHAQQPSGSMTYVVRGTGDLAALVPTIQNAIWEVDPLQTFYYVGTLEQLVGDTLASRRLVTVLLSLFGVVALTLAAVGIYGLIAVITGQRTQEIGLRVALGAQGRDIVQMIVRGAIGITLVGVGVGVLSALALSRSLSALLYEIAAADLPTLILVSGLLVLVAAAAAYVPARRAARVDPLIALRAE